MTAMPRKFLKRRGKWDPFSRSAWSGRFHAFVARRPSLYSACRRSLPTCRRVSGEAICPGLAQPAQQFEKFGKISDAIWSYAELGLQEYKSSKLLADTLEKAGFKVERGLADMPTCFVGTYGSGKPVIGILAEYDALPMLSQEGRNPQQKPVVAGAPGHGCGTTCRPPQLSPR